MFFTGIVGTKEYRKPEWVTHMEELQAALKGKPNASMSHACSFDMSMDSLEGSHTFPKRKTSGGKTFIDETSSKPFYLMESPDSQVSSSASIYSEPNHATKGKMSFVESAMSDYLNSHRHSFSSVIELLDKGNNHRQFFEESLEQIETEPVIEEPEEEFDEPEEVYVDCHDQPFYILSPIEEKSEPSTRSSSFKGSSGSDKRKTVYDHRQKISSSCDAIPSERVIQEHNMQEKYQTFPRAKTVNDSRNFYNDKTMYPLEPRELDPYAFQQLHTADSQEELQEFLLLESECMSDRGRGLATAFMNSCDSLETDSTSRGNN